MATPMLSNSNAESGAGETAVGDSQLPSPVHTMNGSSIVPDINDEPPIEQQPELLFGPNLGQVGFDREGFDTKANVSNDGRLNINIDQKSSQLTTALAPALQSQSDPQPDGPSTSQPYIPPLLRGLPGKSLPPPMNVVIHVVGSRGDVQPFVALGKVLKETYGHRVRLATHGTFKGFVEDNGLEFFTIGGDPAELMAFMVKNPGLMPGMETLKSGDIGKRRKGIYEIIQGCWRSCIEDGDGTTNRTSQVTPDNNNRIRSPFIADAIIANPPSFAHVHCAEKLGIPLHLMFTMPWSPTHAFPHPLANVNSNADTSTTNYVSYALVEMMTWQGLGDLINRFRKKLGLETVSLMWAPGMLTRLQIPYTYCWSPALIPKPNDWGSHITISGFYFLSLASAFTPAVDLQTFLNAGSPPVYIGFGSIVVDDPDSMTELIFEAVKKSGQRALVSKGWGGFGANNVPDGVFMLGNVPHDWLFKHVSCVVHHGGAGTTAAGIALGKPTVVVPFFGDQPFWGAMVAKAGAGPQPIPNKGLTADNLAAGILKCLEPGTVARAQELGERIKCEQGSNVGAESFHDQLNVDSLRCAADPSQTAVWRVKRTTIKLSPFAVTTLIHEGLLDLKDLKLYRPREYNCEEGPWDPISGIIAAGLGTSGDLMMGVADYLKIKSSGNGGKKDQAVESHQQVLPSNNASNVAVQSVEQESQGANPSKGFSHYVSSSGTQAGQLSTNTAMAVGKGTGKMVGVALKTPMDFTLGMAKGFRNAPKLYGDDTVRQADKVTGVQSGLKTAGKEFGLGLYDGITGLVTQPIRGAKKGGFTGAMKGIGKGIGGVILKPSAAACAVPGYTFQGIYKELRNIRSSSVETDIIAARTAQGYNDWTQSSPEQRLEVVKRWQEIQLERGRGTYEKHHARFQSGFHYEKPSSSSNLPLPSNVMSRDASPSSRPASPNPASLQTRPQSSRDLIEGNGSQKVASPNAPSSQTSLQETINSPRPQVQHLNTSHSISRKPVPRRPSSHHELP